MSEYDCIGAQRDPIGASASLLHTRPFAKVAKVAKVAKHLLRRNACGLTVKQHPNECFSIQAARIVPTCAPKRLTLRMNTAGLGLCVKVKH